MTPHPKTTPWRSEPYRRIVAALPCARCGIEGYSQAAHADLGKGMATKTGDETCYPACGPRVLGRYQSKRGCHEEIGRHMSRAERRIREARYARETRDTLRAQADAAGINLPPEPSE